MKQVIAHRLRSAGLFQLADGLRYGIHRVRLALANRAFLLLHPGLVPPPAHLLYEISSSVDYRWYFNSGERWARTFSELIDRHHTGENLSVCEWGCGVGRILRHMRAVNAKIGRRIGLDYDKRMIDWCSKAIPDVEFVRNDLMPPTPITSASLDAVYSYSVFTHLSELAHHAWIAEMRRIIRPGGLLIFTTMGDGCAVNLLPAELAKYQAGELVTRSAKEGARAFVAYESEKFVRDRLLPGSQILAHIQPPSGRVAQDIWVVRM